MAVILALAGIGLFFCAIAVNNQIAVAVETARAAGTATGVSIAALRVVRTILYLADVVCVQSAAVLGIRTRQTSDGTGAIMILLITLFLAGMAALNVALFGARPHATDVFKPALLTCATAPMAAL